MSVVAEPRFDASMPAVVLKFDSNVLHHGGLGVIRSLGRFGVPVFGVHEQVLAPAAYSRYLTGRWVWRPQPEAARVLEDLRMLSRRIGRVAVLLPTDDAGAIFLAEYAGELGGLFRFATPPRDLPREVAGKHSMYRLCRDLGATCPESVLINDLAQARTFVTRMGFPVVAKLAMPWQSARVRSTTIVRSGAELDEVYRGCEGAGLLLQEFIPGGPRSDWFFHGYCDSRSQCVPAFTGLKERSYPHRAGLTSLGRALDNPPLRREATKLLARLGFRGIVDLDFRWDARDGRYKLLDFNPRLGAQFRLFRDAAGMDVALAAYLDLTGQSIHEGPVVLNRTFLVENYDAISALGAWRRGELGLRTWASSVRGADETAWFAWDDLAPFALMCLWMGWRGMSRSLSKHRRTGSATTEMLRTAG